MVELGEQVFYFVPKKLRAKLSLRWRLGTFLGNAQATNECYVGAANGDVVKTRSIVRVVEPNRWSLKAIEGIKGTPHCFRPQSLTETDAHIEELLEPGEHADDEDAINAAVDESLEKPEFQKVDKQLRITRSDLQQFGYTEACPKCIDIENGGKRDWLRHTTNCKLRLYLAFKENNHSKWQTVKHLFEDPEFKKAELDREGAKDVPAASSERLVFEQNTPQASRSRDANAVGEDDMADDEPLDAAMDNAFSLPEEDVADLFAPDDEDMPRAEVAVDDTDAMIDSLRMAGVDRTTAISTAQAMYGVRHTQATPSVMEMYGRSIHDLIRRRNLNIEGLGALDLRTVKADGNPWNFNKKSDRKMARDLVSQQQPEWIIGSPPCTPFSIWNFGIHFKKMSPAKVEAMLEEGRVHLAFVSSHYRMQMRRGKYFLHEHPATALSWREEQIASIARDPTVHVVVGDQCQYGLVTPSAEDKSKLMPALKPTRFMTNSHIMSRQLDKRCPKDHVHQQLVGNRCKDAAFYPAPLVKAMLKGITLQFEHDRQM